MFSLEMALSLEGAEFIVHRPDSSGGIHKIRQNTQKHQNEAETKTREWSSDMAHSAPVISDRRAFPLVFMQRGEEGYSCIQRVSWSSPDKSGVCTINTAPSREKGIFRRERVFLVFSFILSENQQFLR